MIITGNPGKSAERPAHAENTEDAGCAAVVSPGESKAFLQDVHCEILTFQNEVAGVQVDRLKTEFALHIPSAQRRVHLLFLICR